MSDPRTHFSQAFFLALLVQNKPLNVLWLIFDHFFPLSRLLFPVLLWKLIRNEEQHLDDLSSLYLDREWLTQDGETLAPFQDLPKKIKSVDSQNIATAISFPYTEAEL